MIMLQIQQGQPWQHKEAQNEHKGKIHVGAPLPIGMVNINHPVSCSNLSHCWSRTRVGSERKQHTSRLEYVFLS